MNMENQTQNQNNDNVREDDKKPQGVLSTEGVGSNPTPGANNLLKSNVLNFRNRIFKARQHSLLGVFCQA